MAEGRGRLEGCGRGGNNYGRRRREMGEGCGRREGEIGDVTEGKGDVAEGMGGWKEVWQRGWKEVWQRGWGDRRRCGRGDGGMEGGVAEGMGGWKEVWQRMGGVCQRRRVPEEKEGRGNKTLEH